MNKVLPRLVCWLVLLGGCGTERPQLAPVTGKVTLGGEPVAAGTVLFQPERGPGASGRLDAEGRYSLTTEPYGLGAVVGGGIFTIVPPTDMPPLGPQATPHALPPRPTNLDDIPTKFRNPNTSGLVREVISGDNEFNFELKE